MQRDIKYGDNGEDVRLLQLGLNEIMSLNLKCDGWFGKLSEETLRKYQQMQGLAVTGVYSDAEKEQIGVYIENRFLTVAKIVEVSNLHGIPPSMLLAVREVEGRSEGFLPDRRPIILFERHKFYQQLANRAGKQFADTMVTLHPDVCNPQRGGYVGYTGEYPRLEKAMGINKEAAWAAASWGMFQIMGFNYKYCGFAKISDFIDAAHASESHHLDMVVNFIESQPTMMMAVRQKQYKRFAELYNGAAQQGYDVKLKAADEKYTRLGF